MHFQDLLGQLKRSFQIKDILGLLRSGGAL